jgi:hypothetical protein
MKCLAALALASAMTACAQPQKASRVPTPQSRTSLTSEELSRLPPASTLFDAVERLRSEFLTVGRARAYGDPGRQLTVVVNGIPMGGVEALQRFRVDGVRELLYLGASEARQRLGTRVAGPVLLVTLGTGSLNR